MTRSPGNDEPGGVVDAVSFFIFFFATLEFVFVRLPVFLPEAGSCLAVSIALNSLQC